MEKIIVTLLMGLLCSLTGNAQENYEEGMNRAFQLWDQGKPEESAELFESIAEGEKENWLPYYYASEIKIIEAFEMNDLKKKEQQLNEAKALLQKSKAIGGKDNVELMVLEAMLHTGFITLNPMKYGPELSPMVLALYHTAAELDPENPRVALSRAEWHMGAAPYMGEDPKIYCGDVAASLPLFETYESSELFAPDWGEERARDLLRNLCGEISEVEE